MSPHDIPHCRYCGAPGSPQCSRCTDKRALARVTVERLLAEFPDLREECGECKERES